MAGGNGDRGSGVGTDPLGVSLPRPFAHSVVGGKFPRPV